MAIKRYKYSPLGSEFKNQTIIAKKHYQQLDKICGNNKGVVIKKLGFHISVIVTLILTNSVLA